MSVIRHVRWKLLPLVAAMFPVSWVAAQNLVIQDNFTGGSATQNWDARTGACLTAGTDAVGPNKIPACVGLPYYSGVTLSGGQTGTLPDTAGNGALRFTNNSNSETGAVVSNFTFPSNTGLAVSFSTVTYGGTGADGISFFLMDGSKASAVGAEGGSLAYSCSNTNNVYDGLVGAYLGLGMDEYGNFLNQGDNTSTGYNFQAGRIGLRGAGNTAWSWLSSTYPAQYPASLSAANQKAAVQNSCRTGYVWNYSSDNPVQTTTQLPSNYAAIPNANAVLPASTPLYSSATTRPTAIPITYNLKITQNGLLSLAYSYNGGTLQPVLTDQSILAANGPLPPTFKFGFAGSTGGANNIHEVTCFQAGPAESSTSAAGINTQQSGQVKTGTQIYLAYYHSNNWWGQLTSQNLLYSASNNGTVSISPTANWDASCVLTGGSCAATAASSMSAETSANRTILTWNGSAGTPFQWNSLTSPQQRALTAATRLDYLRGDRSNEISSSGSGNYRQRTSVLGDIIDSSPTWVGPPAAPYADTWSDSIYSGSTPPENGGQSYSAFVAANKARLNVVYVGADDGLLHGFRAGAYDSAGNFVNNSTYPNDGKEVLAYMPGPVVQTIHSATPSADYSSAQYAHAYSVNGTPYTGELFYSGAWHSWLVGGLGSGGKGIYALDVTNPANFSEANASTLVMGEWTPASTCAGNATCGNNMGQTYGTPQIRRFHNGKWGFVFGNGLNSTSGKAGIYIVTIDPATAAQTMYYLDSGSTASGNGITDVTPADLDGDHITDYVYAGDVLGHVWRFDLTRVDASSWGVSNFGGASAKPLFTTPNGQPIASKVTVAVVPSSVGASRVVVGFGTGRVTAQQSVTSATTYTGGSQSLYGIWDWDMAGWNASAPSSQKSSLTAPQKSTGASVVSADLQTQSITATYAASTTNGVTGYRTVSNTKVCWQNSTDCTSGNNKYGWTLSLPTSGEQVIYSPILSQGAFIVNTTIPGGSSPLSCSVNANSGWTYAINPATGGAFTQSFFGDANNNFVSYAGGLVSAIQIGAVGSPSVVTAAKSPYLVNQTNSGTGHVDKISPPSGKLGNRLTWQQIR